MEVIHFQRRPAAGQVSIERLFTHLRNAFPAEVRCRVHVSPCFSRGVLPRIRNIRAAQKESADIYHVTGDVQYLGLGLKGEKTVITIHDCASFSRLKGWKREVLRWLWYRLPITRSAVVTTISETTKQELVRLVGCDPEGIRVIHNCAGPEFTPSPRPMNSGRPVVLLVGTAPNKNLERVIAAAGGLNVRLHIIGRLHPNQEELLARAGMHYSNLPRATDREMVDAYRDCDVLVFASLYEGFGLPILEAQATGRPVITSQLSSMPEVAGHAACFVDPRDAGAIRDGLRRVLNNAKYRETLICGGYKNVKRFSPGAVAAQYVEAYREVLKSRA